MALQLQTNSLVMRAFKRLTYVCLLFFAFLVGLFGTIAVSQAVLSAKPAAASRMQAPADAPATYPIEPPLVPTVEC